MFLGHHVMKMIYNELAQLADSGHHIFAQKGKLVLWSYDFDTSKLIGTTHRTK